MPFNPPKKIINRRLIEEVLKFLSTETFEKQIIVYEDNDKIKIIDVSEKESVHKVGFSLKTFLENKEKLLGKEVYIAHNHPSGCLKPSMGDYNSHNFLLSLFRFYNIKIIEEIIIADNEYTFYHLPETKNNSITHPNKKNSLLIKENKAKILKENTFQELNKKLVQLLTEGSETIITRNFIYTSNFFELEQLLDITNNRNEVCIYGTPHYKEIKNLQRIKDIEKVFGSIEFFSLDDNKNLISLKKENII